MNDAATTTTDSTTKPKIGSKTTREFLPLGIAVLTISDTRSIAEDGSGALLVAGLETEGHHVAERLIVPDDIYQIRHAIARWTVDDAVSAILTTGGTGVTGRDSTPEAVRPLLDKEIPGFGEMFRVLSWEEIKTSTVQSRALAGVVNGTYVFCLPGSKGACRLAWDKLIRAQLDYRTRPCNLVELMPRLKEY